MPSLQRGTERPGRPPWEALNVTVPWGRISLLFTDIGARRSNVKLSAGSGPAATVWCVWYRWGWSDLLAQWQEVEDRCPTG